jgi:prophage regulatory protein
METKQMRLLRYSDLKTRGITWSRVHVGRLEKAGKFPKRVHLSENTIAWPESEIDAFLAKRVAERDAA